ncbi:high affinity copper uptake protein 1 [Dendroctonus ponderosae]
MEMSFFFSTSGTVLFSQWKFNSIGGLIGSMIAIYALAFGYEALKFYRTHLISTAISIRQKNAASGDDRFTELTILSKSHLIQTMFHGVQATFSYFLMLIFMTYNAWLCISVVMGLVCGYFVFGWRTPVLSSVTDDHCS